MRLVIADTRPLNYLILIGFLNTDEQVIIPLECRSFEVPNELVLKWSYIDMGFRKRVAKRAAVGTPRTLADLPTGQRCIIDRLDLPEDIARRLMELGFLPGNEVVPGRRAPGGGPRVFRVDGSEVALRDDTAARLYLRRDPESDFIVLS
ncbi:MAG: ferrous iron transport protein A [Acidobacteriaceae bacterium]|nr:ferrous iron transport protein A [Acidobacteriaceae bacterium]MBV9034648.1 ferrous iron transport protein A [Acidobacteriaceae bacterium]